MNTHRHCELLGRGVRVEFRWQLDRYQHVISRPDGSGWIEVFSSIEGTPADHSPVSPPLQSLALDGQPGGRQLALLVGMAGGSHWSISVELDPAADGVHFDVACRVRGESRPLGSLYRALVPIDFVDGTNRIVAGAPDGLRLELDQRFAGTRLDRAIDGLCIAPCDPGPAGAAQTIRWGYWIGP